MVPPANVDLRAVRHPDRLRERRAVNRLLESNREAIQRLCRRYGVARLEAFGSALRNDFRPKSDVDLLVEFAPMSPYERVDAYFGMLDELRQLFNREIDLVMAGTVKNRFMARDIERTKQLIYAA
jgi:predicted nucleotidyltransferase